MTETEVTQAVELMLCPFCGGRGHVEFSRFELHQGYHVVCFGRKDCPLYCSQPYRAFDTEADAITAWNTRTLSLIARAAIIERHLLIGLIIIGAPLFVAIAAMTPN